MKKPSSVHLDIAIFAVEVMQLQTEKERSDWLLSFMQSLVYNKPELNSYGAFLLQEVEMYKEKERERKANFSKKSALSTESTEKPSYRTEQNISSSSYEEKENNKEKSISFDIDKKKAKTLAEKPESVPAHIWNDYMTLRKAKKLPFTQSALNMMIKSAAASNISILEAILICINFSWAGFTSEYYRNSKQKIDSFLFDMRNKQEAAAE